MPNFQRVGMREGGGLLPLEFKYSLVSNTRGGSNKRGGWKISSNLISGEALITAGRVEFFSFV